MRADQRELLGQFVEPQGFTTAEDYATTLTGRPRYQATMIVPTIFASIGVIGGVSTGPGSTGDGADQIYGGDGTDWVFAGGDADTIDGGGGADYLDAGNANDRLLGGDGMTSCAADKTTTCCAAAPASTNCMAMKAATYCLAIVVMRVVSCSRWVPRLPLVSML